VKKGLPIKVLVGGAFGCARVSKRPPERGRVGLRKWNELVCLVCRVLVCLPGLTWAVPKRRALR
jgi:hypothetical protein